MSLMLTRRGALMLSAAPFTRVAFAEGNLDKGLAILNAKSPLGDRVLGDANAKVTLIEYASATCPHCADFHVNILPQLKTEYIETGKVKFIFREFPLDPLALGVFMLTRCLPEEKFFDMTNEFFRTQETWARAQNPTVEITKMMTAAGMDKETFDACIKNDKLAQSMVEYSQQSGKDFSIKGTPAVFVDGEPIRDLKDISKVRQAIDSAINQSAAN